MVKLHTFSVGGMGSIPGWETDPTYCEHSRKKKKKRRIKKVVLKSHSKEVLDFKEVTLVKVHSLPKRH